MSIKIGYQGIKDSWTEKTAKILSKRSFDKVHNYIDLVPLVSSSGVIQELKEERIEYGVVALFNNLGGIVQETEDVLKDISYNIIDSIPLKVSHSLYATPDSENEVYRIVGHEQAIKQCRIFLEENYDGVETFFVDDGMQYLKEDIKKGDRVIAPPMYEGNDIVRLKDNIQDNDDCYTIFILIRLSE